MRTHPKTVLITGCSSGIGRAAAELFLEKNFRVFAAARQEADVKKLHDAGFADALQLDLDDSDSIKHACETVFAKTDHQLSVLCNNAAYGLPAALEDVSREALRAQFETNLFGTHELTNMILPVMRAQNYGRIIQISSVLGLVSLALRGSYNASKYALEGLSDTLRLELARSGIDVCLIEPGPIESAFRANAQKAFERWIDVDNSRFAETYRALYQSRIVNNAPIAFTLPSHAVAKVIYRASTARRPKARYYVTVLTFIFGFLKRILPVRTLDKILAQTGMTTPPKRGKQ